MISSVLEENQLDFLECTDIFSGKILSLLKAYSTKYDFCKFYLQNKNFIAALGKDFIISANDENTDFEELSYFFAMNGFHSILTDEKTGKCFEKELDANYNYNCLLEFKGDFEENKINRECFLNDVYEILKTGFEIDYESWYLDMSHRIRHGVTKVYTLNNSSTCTVQFDINKIAFVSQVATKPEERGNQLAQRLLRTVCGDLNKNGSRVFLACRKELLPFYKNVGFDQIGNVCIITNKETIK